MTATLKPWESSTVVGCTVQITKAGDGLSDALKVDPVELHVNQRVYFVLEGEVGSVAFKRLNPASSDVTRVHTIVTQRITAVEGPEVQAYLDDAEAHVRRAMAEINDNQLELDDPENGAAAAVAATSGNDETANDADAPKKARRSRKAAVEAMPVSAEGVTS